jgi:hypothetical protein
VIRKALKKVNWTRKISAMIFSTIENFHTREFHQQEFDQSIPVAMKGNSGPAAGKK